ncbi:MAG TPA: diaminopimelate decarboxylase [Terriglobia bacterium]|nr:diaminopimelate decarboxylase [Terriglobia bacterium]
MEVAQTPVDKSQAQHAQAAPWERDGFEYRSGQLFCEDAPLRELAAQFGTPLYVYSQAAMLNRVQCLRDALREIPSLLCYSVKANSNLSILNVLREAGCGFDIVSGGELARCLKIGAGGSGIVFSGVGKTAAEIDAALNAGILLFNIESSGEFDLIEARARHHGIIVPISIRINPDVEAETHPYISTGQTIHKFGVPAEEALVLYRRAASSSALQISGIACHIGSQILETAPYLKALDELLSVVRAVESMGARAQYVDLGGGFGVRYAGETRFDLTPLAAGLQSRLQDRSHRLILEPGRFIVGEAGVLLTTVLNVKRNALKNFVVVDAGMNDLIRPALYGSYHGIIPVRDHEARKILADVVGPVCETGDFIARDREVAEVEIGEYLAILSAGAYGSCLASNYNSRPRPAEVLVRGGATHLIRRRETMDDLMAAEML